eukprot:3607049-Rhodomonas_salina.1
MGKPYGLLRACQKTLLADEDAMHSGVQYAECTRRSVSLAHRTAEERGETTTRSTPSCVESLGTWASICFIRSGNEVSGSLGIAVFDFAAFECFERTPRQIREGRSETRCDGRRKVLGNADDELWAARCHREVDAAELRDREPVELELEVLKLRASCDERGKVGVGFPEAHVAEGKVFQMLGAVHRDVLNHFARPLE